MNRIAFFIAVTLLAGCDNFFQRDGRKAAPTSSGEQTVENVAHIPDGCDMLSYIEDTTLDLNARKLCAGQDVQPVPHYLYRDVHSCATELRPMYLKALTNISGFSFDDHIAVSSIETLLHSADWFFDVIGGPCFEESDIEIWADNVVMICRKKRDAQGNIEKNAATELLSMIRQKAGLRTTAGKAAFQRFEKMVTDNWNDYLRNNGQAV